MTTKAPAVLNKHQSIICLNFFRKFLLMMTGWDWYEIIAIVLSRYSAMTLAEIQVALTVMAQHAATYLTQLMNMIDDRQNIWEVSGPYELVIRATRWSRPLSVPFLPQEKNFSQVGLTSDRTGYRNASIDSYPAGWPFSFVQGPLQWSSRE